jgi:RNA polymerase sigma-70 factor, ECF subfamily
MKSPVSDGEGMNFDSGSTRETMSTPSLTAYDPLDLPSIGAEPDEALPAATARVGTFDNMADIVANHEVRIFRFILASLRDRDAAETLTQETFLRAWNARESFRGDCAPHTWLMRIAVNLVRDHTRTDRFKFWKKVATTAVDVTEVSTLVPTHESSAESRLIARQQVNLIWETVETLSERQRTIFLLRFVEELELAEISTVTGLPLSTVKSHLYRALNTVRARHTRPTKESGQP